MSTSTVYRTKRDFVEYGLEVALSERRRPGQPLKTDAYQDALLISIACSAPPSGRCRWTLSLLAERWVALTDMEAVSLETIHRQLKANQLKPWQRKMWCLGQMDAVYIAQMEHILDLYAEPPSPDVPLVNFDEATKQLVGEVYAGKPMAPGQVGKTDYEYERKGVANIFLCFDRQRAWCHAKVTETKKTADFAEIMLSWWMSIIVMLRAYGSYCTTTARTSPPHCTGPCRRRRRGVCYVNWSFIILPSTPVS